jgi:hypothetical protein
MFSTRQVCEGFQIAEVGLRQLLNQLPTPAKPILSVYLRPALLTGVAIVERAGPEMLRMLSSHMMGEIRARFNDAAETMMVQAANFRTTSQLHLI